MASKSSWAAPGVIATESACRATGSNSCPEGVVVLAAHDVPAGCRAPSRSAGPQLALQGGDDLHEQAVQRGTGQFVAARPPRRPSQDAEGELVGTDQPQPSVAETALVHLEGSVEGGEPVLPLESRDRQRQVELTVLPVAHADLH